MIYRYMQISLTELVNTTKLNESLEIQSYYQEECEFPIRIIRKSDSFEMDISVLSSSLAAAESRCCSRAR